MIFLPLDGRRLACHKPNMVHGVGVENEMNSNAQTGSLKYFGSLHWFVIHTKPRDEYRVKNHFEGMEIETLLPLCENFQYSHGRMCRVINPLFPNYLFARLDLERHSTSEVDKRGISSKIFLDKTFFWIIIVHKMNNGKKVENCGKL